MSVLFDLVFIILAFLYLPVFIARRKFCPNFSMRLGRFPSCLISALKQKKNIWIQAVSVGEVRASVGLIEKLKETFPDFNVVVSTTTPTGNQLAKKIVAGKGYVIYFPLDLSFIVKRVISIVNPKLFLTVETEIWPNLIRALSKEGIPIIVVNGRLSRRSFAGYRKLRFILRGVFNRINLFCMQAQEDAQRIIDLGVSPEKVKVTGNMKFDVADYEVRRIKETEDKFRMLLGFAREDKVIVAGSTHKGEEEIILDAYNALLGEFPGLKLLIAPRHIERTGAVERLVANYGFSPLRVSCRLGDEDKDLTDSNKRKSVSCRLGDEGKDLTDSNKRGSVLCAGQIKSPKSIFILDTIGQLGLLYAVATVVIVGGSLIPHGGQNPIEPACLGKPILAGPFMFNFQDVFEMFRGENAIIEIRDVSGLIRAVAGLLGDPQKLKGMGGRARKVVEANRGATERTLGLIKGFIF
jgi:3-deoxy-D-manno-octulosonic-acid transferase